MSKFIVVQVVAEPSDPINEGEEASIDTKVVACDTEEEIFEAVTDGETKDWSIWELDGKKTFRRAAVFTYGNGTSQEPTGIRLY